MFCPKCGDPNVVDIFCAKCLREERPLVKKFREFKVSVCTRCHRVNYRGAWRECEDPAKFIADSLKKHIIPSSTTEIDEIRVAPIALELKSGLKVVGDAEVVVHGRASNMSKLYDEEYSFPYEIQNTLCPRCSKLGTTYFEGTLQVRNETPESREFLKNYLKKSEVGIAKETKIATGSDYLLTNKRVIESSARALLDRFGGTIKSSAQLFSRNKQRSKDIYRVTWFIEMVDFKVGDAVGSETGPLFVFELGKRIKFYNPLRNKFEFHEYKSGELKKLSISETIITETHPELAVLHPETFQQVRVWNLKVGEHKKGEKVMVIIHNDKLFLYQKSKY